MQRDLGNEVIVAIVAVGILAFAVTFAIILSLSSPPAETTTATPTDAATQIISLAETATPSQLVTTSTLPTAANVIQASVIPSDTSTVTQLVPEPTVERTPTPTERQPIATDTEAVSASGSTDSANTTSPPTTVGSPTRPVSRATLTSTPQPTQIPTRTPRPTSIPTQTSTPTVTLTWTATLTPTRTPTSTRTPTATLTRTPTPTATPTLTRTPRPTETSGIRPTPTGVLTAAAHATIQGCIPPDGWVGYVVRRGDTLFSIAQSVSSSLIALQVANCILDPDNIYAGQIILVPREPNLTAFPPNDGVSLNPEGCTDPNSVITNLRPGQSASGVFPLVGTATSANFSYYKIEVRPDFARVYNFYTRSEIRVINGQLAQIDQSVFGTGLHWIKLTVIDNNSGVEPCAIPVYFE